MRTGSSRKIVLDVKNVVADNDNLQTVLALTPSQREVLYSEYPEFVKRIGTANRIVLTGLSKAEKKEFVEQYATMDFADTAVDVIQKADILGNPRHDSFHGGERAQSRPLGGYSCRGRGVRPGRGAYRSQLARSFPGEPLSRTSSNFPHWHRRFLDEVTKHPGLEPAAIAAKVGASAQGVYNQVSKELKPRQLVVKQGRKLYPFRDPNPKDLGA